MALWFLRKSLIPRRKIIVTLNLFVFLSEKVDERMKMTMLTVKQDIFNPLELLLIIIISLYPPPSGLRQSLLLNVALLTSKQESQSEMLSENALPISSRLSCNSEVSRIIIKTKRRKLLPPMELPPPTSVIFYRGVQPMWTTDRWRGSCCSLQSPLSPSSDLILHSSLLLFWTAALRYCSLLHKHSCYDLSPSRSLPA